MEEDHLPISDEDMFVDDDGADIWADAPPTEWDGPPIPDAVDLVRESDDLLAIFAAERFRRVDAFHVEAVAAAKRRGEVYDQITERGIRLELAAAMRTTENTAAMLLWRAELLVRRYWPVLDSLHGARMSERHATELVDAVERVPESRRESVAETALGLAERLPLGKFRRALRALIDDARADTLAERHAKAAATRKVHIEQADDGMAWLMAFLPAVEARAIHTRVTTLAKRLTKDNAQDDRTLDQARADVLGDLLVDGETDALPATLRGIRPTVTVTVPALALLGSENAGQADVEGVGPIPLDVARRLSGAAKGWMRVLTHPESGVVLSVGREQYKPPAALRRMVQWRAGTCRAPGCTLPADRCEIDHTIDWDLDGKTELGNLAPLCKGHHDVKHHTSWAVVQREDGTMEWTSPTGRRYREEPPRKGPAFTPTPTEPAPF